MPSDLREQPACMRTAFAKSELATRSLRAMLTGTMRPYRRTTGGCTDGIVQIASTWP